MFETLDFYQNCKISLREDDCTSFLLIDAQKGEGGRLLQVTGRHNQEDTDAFLLLYHEILLEKRKWHNVFVHAFQNISHLHLILEKFNNCQSSFVKRKSIRIPVCNRTQVQSFSITNLAFRKWSLLSSPFSCSRISRVSSAKFAALVP